MTRTRRYQRLGVVLCAPVVISAMLIAGAVSSARAEIIMNEVMPIAGVGDFSIFCGGELYDVQPGAESLVHFVVSRTFDENGGAHYSGFARYLHDAATIESQMGYTYTLLKQSERLNISASAEDLEAFFSGANPFTFNFFIGTNLSHLVYLAEPDHVIINGYFVVHLSVVDGEPRAMSGSSQLHCSGENSPNF
jgi:hypothetical protein